MNTFIFFHAKKVTPYRACIDGLFAAAVMKKFHPDATIIPAMYGCPPDLNSLDIKAGDKIILLDLSYKQRIIQGWINSGFDVTLIDHHKQAIADLLSTESFSRQISVTYDAAKSGAGLAWEYCTKNQENDVPKVVSLVQDYDTWAWKLEGTGNFNTAIKFIMDNEPYEKCIEIAQHFIADEYEVHQAINYGLVLETLYIQPAIEKAVDRSSIRNIDGYDAAYVKVKDKHEIFAYSRIGHELLKRHPKAAFAVVETRGGWALRSENDREDVEVIARRFGGDGHRNAAGCRKG